MKADIEDLVLKWATARGLLEGASQDKFALKLAEEAGELARAVLKCDRAATMDAIGDCTVVLINIAHKIGSDLGECLEVAYQVIKDRKGEMVNGTFIKAP